MAGMEETRSTSGRAASLIDELAAANAELARAQAKRVALMLSFTAARTRLDEGELAGRVEVGERARFRPGEFACIEIGLATTCSRYRIGRLTAMAQRLQEQAPDVWDAWQAGDIDEGRAFRVNRALLRLTRTESRALLNAVVVDVARCKTEELLGRWLGQFVARVEPDQAAERLRRSFDDRYACVRPDIDGISFLSAAISCLDAAVVDRTLDALAAAAGPDDPRTHTQRRADALVDVLLGRTSNGCHVTWVDDDLDDDQDHDSDGGYGDDGINREDGAGDTAVDPAEVDEWDLPASAFRPDPRNTPPPDSPDDGDEPGEDVTRPGRAVIARCTRPHTPPAAPATIGVIVSIQSLFGSTDRPGQLADRSAPVDADSIRDLAATPGTLFYRLLTDAGGNLLDVTEMGRFASTKLATAITFRDGTCQSPICAVGAHRCDLDHAVPVPDGPTSAENLGAKCRFEHRAKTHAGHTTTRPTPHTTTWRTPTGHTYTTGDDPLPVEDWPDPEGASGVIDVCLGVGVGVKDGAGLAECVIDDDQAGGGVSPPPVLDDVEDEADQDRDGQ